MNINQMSIEQIDKFVKKFNCRVISLEKIKHFENLGKNFCPDGKHLFNTQRIQYHDPAGGGIVTTRYCLRCPYKDTF